MHFLKEFFYFLNDNKLIKILHYIKKVQYTYIRRIGLNLVALKKGVISVVGSESNCNLWRWILKN